MGCIKVVRGEFEQANMSFQHVLEIFDPSLPFHWELTSCGYAEVGAKGWQMVCLQILGHMDQAKNLSDKHLPFAREHKDSMTLYHIYTFPALYKLLAREWKASEEILEKYLPIAKAFGDPIFNLTADVYYNIAKAYQGDRSSFDMAVNLINVCFNIGFKAFAVTMSPNIGELYFRNGEHESALAWIEKILAHVNQTDSHSQTAELMRIKALILQTLGKPDKTVEKTLRQALELSRKQAAKTFELRAARGLARIWQKQGKKEEACELLKGVYDWFTEGFNSVDLKEANILLKELNS
jgi:tetratricopeptide (TPR) repeat protein